MLRFVRRRLARELLFSFGLPSLALALAGVAWLHFQMRHVAPSLWSFVLVFVLVLALGAASVHLLAVRVLVELPLARIVAALKRAEQGDFLFRVPVETTDEIGELARSFNTALAAITDLHVGRLEDARSIESMRREIELTRELEAQHRLLDATNRQLQGRVRELTLLSDLAHTLNSTLDLEELLRFVTDRVGRVLGYDTFALLLVDDATGELVVKRAIGFDPRNEAARIPLGHGLAGWAAQHRELVVVRDTRDDPRFAAERWTGGRQGSLLAVPLVFQERCEGVLDLFRPDVDAFGADEIWFLESLASQAALAIANARLHQRTVALSLTDELTQLHNRRSLFQRLEMELERSERFSQPFAVAAIDVDRFKELNDAHGHLAGDATLQRVARLLGSAVRRVDTLARWGGEEFALVLPRTDRDAAMAVADKLRETVASAGSEHGPGVPARVTISVGVATFPDDARDIPTLVDSADAALFAAKRRGRNTVVAYEPGMRQDPGRRRDIRATGRAEVAPDSA